MLTELDALTRDTAPAIVRSSEPAHAAARPAPRARPPTPPVASEPSGRTDTTLEIDQQLEEITRGLDELLTNPRSAPEAPAPGPLHPAPPVKCARCHSNVATSAGLGACESCGRPVCADCLDLAAREGHPGLCPICAMLLDGAGPA